MSRRPKAQKKASAPGERERRLEDSISRISHLRDLALESADRLGKRQKYPASTPPERQKAKNEKYRQHSLDLAVSIERHLAKLEK